MLGNFPAKLRLKPTRGVSSRCTVNTDRAVRQATRHMTANPWAVTGPHLCSRFSGLGHQANCRLHYAAADLSMTTTSSGHQVSWAFAVCGSAQFLEKLALFVQNPKAQGFQPRAVSQARKSRRFLAKNGMAAKRSLAAIPHFAGHCAGGAEWLRGFGETG